MSETRYPVDWPEKKSSSNQCPDISGVYYERASDAYGDSAEKPISGDWDSGLVTYWDVVCSVIGEYNYSARDYMKSRCSLRYYIDPRKYNWRETGRCPEKKIEFSKTENLNIDVVFYRKNRVVNKLSMNLDGTKYRCEDGSIVLGEQGSLEETFYHRTEIFPTTGGSLVVKDYDKRISGLLLYPLLAPPGPTTSLWLYRWGSVDSGVNPYKDCH